MKFKLRLVAISVVSLTVAFLLLALDKHNQAFENTAPNGLPPSRGLQTTPPVDPWTLWAEWVKVDSLYSPDAFWSSDMNTLLHALASAPITAFDVGYKGTQLKATMHLGAQKTIFKPKRCEIWACGFMNAILSFPSLPVIHVRSSSKVTHIRGWICTQRKLLVFIWTGI